MELTDTRQFVSDRNAYWARTIFSDFNDIKRTVTIKMAAPAEEFFNLFFERVIPLVEGGDVAGALRVASGDLVGLFEAQIGPANE